MTTVCRRQTGSDENNSRRDDADVRPQRHLPDLNTRPLKDV